MGQTENKNQNGTPLFSMLITTLKANELYNPIRKQILKLNYNRKSKIQLYVVHKKQFTKTQIN